MAKTPEEKAAAKAAREGQKQAPAKAEVAATGFAWAVNKAKLQRAIEHVKTTQKGLVGKEYADAVRERYEALGGLVGGARRAAAGNPVEVNMAPNDGDNDEDKDDEDPE